MGRLFYTVPSNKTNDKQSPHSTERSQKANPSYNFSLS